MAIEYRNRRGDVYYVKISQTKRGNERYYIIRDKAKYSNAELLDDLPSGFEFYEFPEDARVVLRKRLKSSITTSEIETIKQEMEEHETVKDYIIDKSEDSIFVCKANIDKEVYPFGPGLLEKIQTYSPVLKFEKHKNGTYAAQRFCQISRYYGWITMETSSDLMYLAEKFCYHLDKESLLDFWIEGEEDF